MGLSMLTNPVVETYSRLAADYDNESNSQSCWAYASQQALESIVLRSEYGLVVDVGCGTGKALVQLAAQASPATSFIGLDPAPNMRVLARQRTQDFRQVQILDGSFEQIPLISHSVDYLFSILAFHWATDLDRAVSEIARVLRTVAAIDIVFVGRNNGREFIQKTSPIFLKYMGPALFVQSAKLRKQLTKDEAFALFTKYLDPRRLLIEESYTTFYDTLEGHLGWWVRIEGQFVSIPAEKRRQCDSEVKKAISTLQEDRGIPYTIHQLHVKLGNI
jgi:ubiquinone/menaquinone biosynthesis C-methylase UbiE